MLKCQVFLVRVRPSVRVDEHTHRLNGASVPVHIVATNVHAARTDAEGFPADTDTEGADVDIAVDVG